ncbi:MAG: putative toxin-antitoxin system toxin component, PIN family [Spirochaetia bacterium]|nr:putative toxin-antitoxin system toxin component, PIN family [Spirochaetia bacterium]
MNKIVIDTNVLISAILFSGIPNQVLQEVISERYHLYLSHDILNEFLHVLSRSKFKLLEPQIKQFYEEIIHITNIVYPMQKLLIVKEDPSDNMLFECAIEANANFIVSGNKHVLNVKKYKNIEVITPRNFIQICNNL